MARRPRSADRVISSLGKSWVGLDLDFSNSPTIWKFLNDDSFFRGIMGPVGSGKSYACASEVMLRAIRQPPSTRDGVRRSRFAIIRNSYPELKTTTINTWREIFPENVFGPMRWSPPLQHVIHLPERDGAAPVELEVLFLALDKNKDVRKLLSLELTGAWVNEAREIPLSIIEGLTHRVGRYPPKADGGPAWRGIWADTNPMDSDSWWHERAEIKPVKGKYAWRFFRQPGAMLEVKERVEGAFLGADRWWADNEKAENIPNLPPGYYHQQLGGKALDWIQCYVGGQYVFVKEGRPVWGEYDDTLMVSEAVEAIPGLPLQVGLDFGLTPAAVIGQRTARGVWCILHEVVSRDMGLERFAQRLLYELNTRWPNYDVQCYGDPAGTARDQIFEVTAFDHLRSVGLTARPAPSNNFAVRREAGAAPMLRLIDGKPGLLVWPECRQLRKALAGGYHFKRVGIDGGRDRFHDVPNKNESSHIGDAYGYLLSGGGEHRRLTVNSDRFFDKPAQFAAKIDFKIWG